jgi:hypothetical protein
MLRRNADLFVLCVITAVSRWVFAAHSLYEWDSVQFALAIRRFDILWHQPHPPGYVWYVAFIKAAHLAVGDENLAIIAANVVFSLLTLISFYHLSRMVLRARSDAFISSLLLIVNPIFWFCGSTATIYTVEAFISTFMGLLLLRCLRRADGKYLYLSSFFMGFLGGFRPTTVVLLGPLWLFVVLRRSRGLRDAGINGLIFLATSLSWIAPTIMNTGGLQSYLSSSRGLTGSGSEKALTWFGGYGHYLLNNTSNYMAWLIAGMSPIGPGFIAYAMVKLARNHGKLIAKKEDLLFFAIWVLPAMLFYSLYIEKPGYLLIIIPPLLLLFSWSVKYATEGSSTHRVSSVWRAGTYCSTIMLFVLWFTWPYARDGIPEKLARPVFVTQPALSDYNWDISLREIRQRDYTMTFFEDYLRSNGYAAENTALFWAGGYPTWRHMMYYLPHYQCYWLADGSVSGMPSLNTEIYEARDYQVTSESGKPFWIAGTRPANVHLTLSRDIETLIWIANPDTTIYEDLLGRPGLVDSVELPNGQVMLVTTGQFASIDLGDISVGY